MDIGERIKKKREACGMSQEDLAEKMGYKSKTSIFKVENGVTDLPLSKVTEFAKALHTSPKYLMGWDVEDADDTDDTVEAYKLDEYQRAEYEKIVNMNVLMFNGKRLPERTEKKLRAALKEAFIEVLEEERKKEGR